MSFIHGQTPRHGAAARAARELFSQLKSTPVDVRAAAALLGAEIEEVPYLGQGDVSFAILRRRPARRDLVGLNAARPETRRRFAAAAALGRLRLHPDVEFFLESRPQLRAGDAASAEAAVFAAVLLVPFETIAEIFHDADVEDDGAPDLAAAACGVSVSVVRFRVGLLSMGLEK